MYRGPTRVASVLLAAAFAGCGHGRDPADRSVALRIALRFSEAALATDATQAELTIYAQGSGAKAWGPALAPVAADTVVFDNVTLAPGTYGFDVFVYDGLGDTIGRGLTVATIDDGAVVNLDVFVVTSSGGLADVTVEVTVTGASDTCITLTPLETADGFPVYQDVSPHTFNMGEASGWMGYIGGIAVNPSYTTNPYEGNTSFQVVYTPNVDSLAWSGIYWLPVREVEPGWSNVTQGWDLRGATAVAFAARGAVGGEVVEFFAGGVSSVPCPENLRKKGTSPTLTTLTPSWTTHQLSLTSSPDSVLAHVVGLFGWVATRANNPSGATFYIDHVRYVR